METGHADDDHLHISSGRSPGYHCLDQFGQALAGADRLEHQDAQFDRRPLSAIGHRQAARADGSME